ncbi:unnamed protein product [Vitrella brassicaformis CCMP3155]|uniref:peptide-methionine (S)-S-oxide reductase n=1 Tax=Vitrella brassicaformis (strain CCMP3155) TaxID=1169540 RepID=A0A0G4EHN3_VITBC|nr:unnamed protein product [Vitrella brassicaformis CCMP3155]|eukprot:CEL95695.1 unnamed protein product [Vitrella brassicaformis CCMP3155]
MAYVMAFSANKLSHVCISAHCRCCCISAQKGKISIRVWYLCLWMGSSMASKSTAIPEGPNLVKGADPSKPTEYATFAGGCFWGMEKWFRKEFGAALKSTSVGYIGGQKASPTYEDVCTGGTGHAEALQLEYYPDKVDYATLLDYFWRLHDPTTLNRQGNDVGTQYRSAIFYHSDSQKEAANAKMAEMQGKQWGAPITTQVVPAKPEDFFRAEGYHQLYLDAHPGGYCNHFVRPKK